MVEKIKLLKQEINIELDSLKYDESLSSVVDVVKKHINSIQFEDLGELAQKKVYAYLEHFKDYQIKEFNKLIVRSNADLFDDTDTRFGMMIEECEDEIEKVISYLESTMAPIGAEARDLYNKTKNRFLDLYEDSLEYNRTRFFREMGLPSQPYLAVYGFVSTLNSQYYNRLSIFKTMYIDNLRLFMDNDQKIKESFAKAEEEFKDNEVLGYILELKNNYLKNLDECMQSYSDFNESDVITLQKEMLSRSFEVDELVNSQQKKNEFLDYLNSVTFKDYDLDKLAEISKFANSVGLIYDELYDVLFLLAEKSKYVKLKMNFDDGFFDKFDERTLLNLQKRYIDRFDLLSPEEKKEVLKEYKEKGYKNVVDRRLFEEFEKEVIINRPKLVVEDVKYDDEKKLTKEDAIRILHEYNKKGNGFIKKKHHFKFSLMDKPATTLEKINSNLYHLSVYYGGDNYYFDGEGHFLDYLPTDIAIKRQIYDFYLSLSRKDQKAMIYDLNGNLLYEMPTSSAVNVAVRSEDARKYSGYLNNFYIGIDYKNEKVYLFDSIYSDIVELDRHGHVLREIKPSDITDSIGKVFDPKKSHFFVRDINEGVLPIHLRYKYSDSKASFGYYDLNKMKLIDSCDDLLYRYHMFGEGLLPARSKATYDFGYTDIDNEFVINPAYKTCTSFAGGVANVTFKDSSVKDSKVENFFIDRHGNRIDSDLCPALMADDKYDIYPRYKENRLGIYYDDDLIKFVKADYHYTLDNDTKLLEYSKEKGRAKKIGQIPSKNQ